MLKLKCDAVFQGGGVKGIGFAGAISAIERAGYEFVCLAGTSAGAIVAALLAVGYKAAEIEQEIMKIDYSRFCEETRLSRFGMPGKILSIGLFLGMYKTHYFEDWLGELLQRKGKMVFGDIRTGSNEERDKYKFQAIASDISLRKMMVLPRALEDYGIDPDGFSIARAVRMSMSIPFYFVPYRLSGTLRDSIVVDGGLLSNYPVWLLDDGTENPRWPTFGFKFAGEPEENAAPVRTSSIGGYTKAVVETLLEAHDNHEMNTRRGDHRRSIEISADIVGKKIHTTYFDITREESKELYQNGVIAAERFLEGWDFEKWVRLYRRKL